MNTFFMVQQMILLYSGLVRKNSIIKLLNSFKNDGKDLAVFSRMDVFVRKEECAGGTRLMRKDI